MSDADLVVTFIPILLLLVTFILYEVVKPLLPGNKGKGKDDSPAPVIGEPVSGASQSGWQAAYDSVMRELADEHNDHISTVEAHEICHAVMLEHGIEPPRDHG